MKQQKRKKFVVLHGLQHDNVFFSTNSDSDPTRLANGKVAYEVLGYTDTVEEAQAMIADWNIKRYGDADFPLKLYLAKMAGRMAGIDFDNL